MSPRNHWARALSWVCRSDAVNNTITLHATAVTLAGRAILIRGASGRGKSALALQLMALGAGLIADDQVTLTRRGDRLIASCPPALRGLIEARGVGILNAAPQQPAAVAVVVDLDQVETDRLPPHRRVTIVGCEVPLIYFNDGVGFASAIVQYLRAGRNA